MGLLGSNNGHGMASPQRRSSNRPCTSSLVSSAAERAVTEDPTTEIWDPFSGRPRPTPTPTPTGPNAAATATNNRSSATSTSMSPPSTTSAASPAAPPPASVAAAATATSTAAAATATSTAASPPPAAATASATPPSAAAAATVAAKPTVDNPYRTQIETLVLQVIPHEKNNIDVMMEQFEGREKDLVSMLKMMLQQRSSMHLVTSAATANAANAVAAKDDAVVAKKTADEKGTDNYKMEKDKPDEKSDYSKMDSYHDKSNDNDDHYGDMKKKPAAAATFASASCAGTLVGAFGMSSTTTTTSTQSGSTSTNTPMSVDQLLASVVAGGGPNNNFMNTSNMSIDFMPQEMPSGPATPAASRPQRPGAYRGSPQASSLERNTSLYKGGRDVLGRESRTVHRADSTQYGEIGPPTSHRSTLALNEELETDNDEPPLETNEDEEAAQADEERPRIIHIVPSKRDVQMEKDHDAFGKSSMTSSKLYKIIGIAVIALVVLIVAIVVGVVVGSSSSSNSSGGNNNNNNKNNNNNSGSSSGGTGSSGGGAGGDGKPPILEQLEEVFGDDPSSVLAASTIVEIQYGSPANNPQQLAFQWLQGDPKLQKYSLQQKRQRLALATIYFATNGPNWFTADDSSSQVSNKWLDYGLHECEWFSLARGQQQEPCYNYTSLHTHREQHVDYKSLVLSGNPLYTNYGINPALQGTLPPQVGLLTALQSLDLGYQSLKGTIPTQLVDLAQSKLSRLILEQAFFTGTIPDGLYEFIKVLRLNRNHRLADGFVPTLIGRNKDLTHLGLVETNRKGTIPPELFQISTLQQVLLNENRISGTLPTQIGRLGTSLQQFNLNINKFVGPIPSQMGLLQQLEYFLVGGNRFSGTLPTQIGLLSSSLEELEFKKNEVSGQIPSQLGSLTKLSWLDLAENNFVGNLPTSLSQLSELRILNLNNNAITGSLRAELLGQFKNNTDGTTGTSLQPTWPKLETMVLASNEMTGTIPSQIGLCRSLEELNLRSNNFRSTLPAQVSQLEYLQRILLEATRITGSVPNEICDSLLFLDTFRVECNRVECPATCQCICA